MQASFGKRASLGPISEPLPAHALARAAAAMLPITARLGLVGVNQRAGVDVAPCDERRMTTAACRAVPIAAGIPGAAADIPENS
jgi:hypothetical protein